MKRTEHTWNARKRGAAREGVRLKTWEKAMAAAFLLCILFHMTGFFARCDGIESSVLRMHVIANSDSEADQALKLKVRDRVLEESESILEGVTDKAGAEAALRGNLDRLASAAEAEVRAQGFDYPVTAALENTYFPTRQYETVTLPAGRYDALRLMIGRSEGHNWWCVIFPAMCLPAAEEGKELSEVLNADELDIVEDAPAYKIGFKTVELFEQLRDWLRGN